MKKICFLVGSIAISGGTYVILQHASYLSKMGFAVTLAIQEPFNTDTLKWHDAAPLLRCVPFEDAKHEDFDLVIATWWKTALELGHFRAQRFGYFVQSIESRFYSEEELPLRELVNSTYTLPVSYVTEASWIAAHLKEKFSSEASLVRNGIRKDIYSTHGESVSTKRCVLKKPRVLVEGHFGVSFKNTALALRLAKRAGAEEIWVLTGSPIGWVPYASKIFSRIPMWETSKIYQSCDILLKLSTVEGMFGPPLEMFHCGGTAVVFDVTGHDEYIEHEKNALVVKTGDIKGVVSALKNLLEDHELLSKLKGGALDTANNWPSWEDSSYEFMQWIEGCLRSDHQVACSDLIEIRDKAFSKYVHSEQLRINNQPFKLTRQRLSRVASMVPRSFRNSIPQVQAITEVLFGRQRVR